MMTFYIAFYESDISNISEHKLYIYKMQYINDSIWLLYILTTEKVPFFWLDILFQGLSKTFNIHTVCCTKCVHYSILYEYILSSERVPLFFFMEWTKHYTYAIKMQWWLDMINVRIDDRKSSALLLEYSLAETTRLYRQSGYACMRPGRKYA